MISPVGREKGSNNEISRGDVLVGGCPGLPAGNLCCLGAWLMAEFLFAAFVVGQAFALLVLREISEAHTAAMWAACPIREKVSVAKVDDLDQVAMHIVKRAIQSQPDFVSRVRVASKFLGAILGTWKLLSVLGAVRSVIPFLFSRNIPQSGAGV